MAYVDADSVPPGMYDLPVQVNMPDGVDLVKETPEGEIVRLPSEVGGDLNQQRLFGTDGVRGVANLEPITSETALKLGRALAHEFRNTSGRHRRILIGKDTRLSGYMLETAMASGICSMGVDTWLVGPLPTPGIAFLTRSMRADAGVVISASHNPYQDNGIKFFSREGFKLDDATERRIEELVFDDTSAGELPGAWQRYWQGGAYR